MSAASFAPSGPLRGSLRPPPDKSISHRAAIIGAMCEGTVLVEGYLDAADTRSTLDAVRALGAGVRELGASETAPGGIDLEIDGVGLRGPAGAAETVAIDVGNAGTLMRLLPGWLAGQPAGSWVLDGDSSIRRRPVDRVAEPLREMGADVQAEGGLPPLRVSGAPLHGINYRLPVASAQVKSCVLLAGLLAEGETTVVEPAPTRDHTERMLRAAGVRVSAEPASTPIALRGRLPGARITVAGSDRLRLEHQPVPADFSSGAFALVAAVLVRGSEVTVREVGLNPTRIGLLGILNRMGASIEVAEAPALAGEPRGAVTARHGVRLAGARVGEGDVPLTIDELPLVALLGCFAEGETVVSGAEELRHKESDRIESVVAGLAGLGARIEATEDGFVVEGGNDLRGGVLDSHGDHRLAMLGAVAGLASREGVRVEGFEAAGISYPGFESDLTSLIS